MKFVEWRWPTRTSGLLLLVCVALALPDSSHAAEPRQLDRVAGETLTAVEMNHGDSLRFQLKSGAVRTFALQSTRAWIVEQLTAGIVYAFECQLLADGQPVVLRRFVCSQ